MNETNDRGETPRAPEHAGPEHPFEEGEEAAPPGVRAMSVVRWLLLTAMVLAALASVYAYVAPRLGQEAGSSEHATKYHCPMHPQITSDAPGECPICHMNLEPMPEHRPAPVGAGMEGTPMRPSGESLPEGTAPVTLALDRTQAIGVRTALVERRETSDRLRVTATVEAPDRGRAEVHFRAEGFIEAIRVRELGVKVKAGELLASVYSPEIFQAQQELIAMQGWQSGAGGTSIIAPPTDAARKRLELLGLDRSAIEQIVRTGKPIRAVGVTSPISGYVVGKNAVLGSRITPATVLFEIADLSKVYVIASLYSHQLAAIGVGDRASFTSPALPGRVFEAKVDLIYPDVDLATRTSRVRFQIENADLALRPGQFGTAELTGTTAADLTVPLDAVIDTGQSVYVFVAGEGGTFAPRRVELGGQVGDRFAIARGLVEGERVVSGATFLIDAESRLQASLSANEGAAAPGVGAPAASACDADFDRAKHPDKWAECKRCEAHRGMGSMEEECRNQIPKPWR